MELLSKLFYSTHHSPLLCLLLLLHKCFTIATSSAGNETDKLALLAFKEHITGDLYDTMSSWNDSTHFCYWQGVSCSKRHFGRVQALDMGGKNLAGTLPPQIGNLSFLRHVNLSGNLFRAEIPQQVGYLTRLGILDLSSNGFQGEIPGSIANCSDLYWLDLTSNNLVGEIPSEFNRLSRNKIQGFSVEGNNLSGTIPAWLGNATYLFWLSIGENNFQGTIPSDLGGLLNLQILQMTQNNLSGIVPLSIYNISSLQYLSIGHNQLHGEIPSDVWLTLHNLEGLLLSKNYFTGLIPVSLANASKIIKISFTGNNIIGTVPQSLGSLKDLMVLQVGENSLENKEGQEFHFLTSLTNCSKLQMLDISFNKFIGELPTSVSNFSNELLILSMGENQISGPIPEGIEALRGLQRLELFDNMITGKIPTGIGKLKNLGSVWLDKNRFSGVIPSSLGNLTHLIRLNLSYNDLEDNIPSSLGNCQELQELLLADNRLRGSLPKEGFGLSITNFSLARNFLSGELPSTIGNMTKLLELDLSGNRLSGDIPGTIGSCEMLEKLVLENNSFEGSIPSTLSNLKNVRIIDLSRNNLSGYIPAFMQNFTILELLNLSFNSLEGEVPKDGIFRNQTRFSIVGNGKLCGGLKNLGLPECQVGVPKRKGLPLVLKVVIPTAIACSVLTACLCFVRMRMKKVRADTSSDNTVGEQFQKVSYAELSQATNGFSSSNLIGQGGYGSVYQGVLGNGGMAVAVKVFNLTQKGVSKSFLAECNALRNIRHRNLLKIITVCSSIDFKGEDFKALVFEFMPNGSLEEWLYHGENSQYRHQKLSLTQRISIAIDVACALEYLHHGCGASIVHGDLKPSNILLDHEMVARVGDFGLARVLCTFPSDNSYQYPTSSSGLKGTIGYVAPEYGTGGTKTLQGDIYSFGIMLLEMHTGIKPTADIFSNGMDLHQHVKSALPENIPEIVEPTILSNGEDDFDHSDNPERSSRMVKTKECVAEILRVGVLCSTESPVERMGIKDVVMELNKIKQKYIYQA